MWLYTSPLCLRYHYCQRLLRGCAMIVPLTENHNQNLQSPSFMDSSSPSPTPPSLFLRQNTSSLSMPPESPQTILFLLSLEISSPSGPFSARTYRSHVCQSSAFMSFQMPAKYSTASLAFGLSLDTIYPFWNPFQGRISAVGMIALDSSATGSRI